MSNGKLFQSFGAATLKAREVEHNFVRESSSKCSSADRKYLVGLSANSHVEAHQNNEVNMSTVHP